MNLPVRPNMNLARLEISRLTPKQLEQQQGTKTHYPHIDIMLCKILPILAALFKGKWCQRLPWRTREAEAMS